MGQYWMCVNLDKCEFIHPHKLGVGLKLWEQLANTPGTGAALVVLCAAMPEPRGGGDLRANPEGGEVVVGRWAGDRIALVGDYAEDSDLPPQFEASRIYDECLQEGDEGYPGRYKDISNLVAAVIGKELGGKFVGDGWKEFITLENETRRSLTNGV